MRLNKIRLAGFKSFVDPTTIPFPGDMTAIVGPNGCGKSNVIDAVRWVLGESSAKNLRGDSMTDVIFNGSSSRKPVSQCSVELVFDNSSGRIVGEFASYSEVSVKRVVTKDAVSSYFLNSSKCRRRDITDLFLGTGLGPRSYAIIEQGMISRLIESKPQELRVFIEEAAGISKYKERRKETLSRIKQTKDNLERLDDIRQGLAEQIAKLKRQALAATRYKELKQQERLLKSELATLKWLAQSEIMAAAQSAIKDKQQELENIVVSQQGEQSTLQVLKNRHALVKQSLDDLQQQSFSVSGEVTKVEQSQLFAKKRAQQIALEIAQIEEAEHALNVGLARVEDEISQAQEKRSQLEPDKEVLEAQLYELEDKKLDADTRFEDKLKLSKEKDEQYQTERQFLQQKHGQIQQTLSLQARTETRLFEIETELSNLNDSPLSEELAQLQQQRTTLASEIVDQQTHLSSMNEKVDLAKQAQQQALEYFERARNTVAQVLAKLEALESLQVNSLSENDNNNQQCQQEIESMLSRYKKQAVWECFRIQSGGEEMLNSVLQDVGSAWVIDTALSSDDVKRWLPHVWENMRSSLYFKDSFTTTKLQGTLASFMLNDEVPCLFNQYFVANDDAHALALVSTIADDERVLTKTGHIYTVDSFIKRQTGDNKIARAAQIERLSKQYKEEKVNCESAEKTSQHNALVMQELKNERDAQQLQLQLSKQKQQQLEIKYQNTLFQEQQSEQRSKKLSIEIQQHQERLAQESMCLELLNEEVEQISENVTVLEAEKLELVQATDSLRSQQQQWQAQHSGMQSRLHQHEMAIQQIRNTLQILQEQKRNKEQQLKNSQDKLSLLQLEEQDLLMPQEQQHEKLQMLLTQQAQLRHLQVVKSEELSNIQTNINDIEKGQHSITTQIDEIKQHIESHRIALESASVRAQSFVEQLGQYQQSIKQVIDNLPEHANESGWQETLASTTSAISRLGAVNLAAVEEYESQCARKEHLDAQNLDLTQALDTLEDAMKKIDKETRTRFKQTFDTVNNDLKNLFPKVFGGGMAYLALNDDDMLETGVTIMARPPGKKNSTIGLLSGGEKALTALSLVFAIFRLNPAPFCLLDEVDAPLDDANVGRFCALVSQMSQSVQFIYITHNKVAMEMASHLTGVTMAEPGVSRMVAVDMEQALAIAQ